MSQKIEGTLLLEGLIEGPLPPIPDAREKLEAWAASFAKGALKLSLQIDQTSNHFSAIPANQSATVKQLLPDPGMDPSFIIADSLTDLLRLFPPLEKTQVFSTLRSVEVRHNEEIQTLYAIGEGGRATTRQQTVPAQTISPDQSIPPRDILKRGGIGLLIAIALLALSSFFIDYRALWLRLTATVEPVKVQTDEGLFAPYFKIEVTSLDKRTGTLNLKLTRTPLYPRDEKSLDDLFNTPPETPASAGTLRRRLAIESLAKGTVRIQLLDKDGRILTESSLRIDLLEKFDTLETSIPAPYIDQHPVTPTTLRALPN